MAAAGALGLDVAGVDVVCEDCGQPLEDQRGAVVEVNAGPGLRMHLEPSAGRPRDVGAAVVDALFPNEETGRIPVVAVAGGSVVARLIAWLCRAGGRFAGLACRDGLLLNGRLADSHDAATAGGARSVLANRRTQVAVLEVSPRSIEEEGLGFDQADVTVMIGSVVGAWDAGIRQVVSAATKSSGCVILDGISPQIAAIATKLPQRALLFAADEAMEVLMSHRRANGPVAFVRDGMLMLAEGPDETGLVSAADIPAVRNGHLPVEAALAGVAAAWRLGVSPDCIRDGLRTFEWK